MKEFFVSRVSWRFSARTVHTQARKGFLRMVLVWWRNRFWNLVVAVICCEVIRAVLFSCGGTPIHPFVNPPA